MDLRALALRGAITAVTAAGPEPPTPAWQPSGQPWEPLLMAGCVIAQEMRAALKVPLHLVPNLLLLFCVSCCAFTYNQLQLDSWRQSLSLLVTGQANLSDG